MAEIYIDLRNNSVRLIVAEGSTLSHAHFPDTPIKDPGQLSDLMTKVKAVSGGDISRAHLIIPADEVTVSFHKTQALEIADARMIIGRAVAADTADDDPVFRLTRMAAEQNQQVYLAEYIPRTTIEKYISMFHKAGLKLLTVTSDLQVNQTLFPLLHGEIHRVQAIFDLGHNSVGAFFFSPTEFMWYELTSGRDTNGENPESLSAEQGEDHERSDRRRVYESMNNLHNLYSRFMNINPEASVEKIWLSGSESNMGGLAEAITEGMGVEAELLVPEEVGDFEDGHAYAALAGFIKMVKGKRTVNFIPEELQKSFRVSSSIVCLAIGVIYLVALLSGVMAIERNYRNLQDSLETEKNGLASLKASNANSRNKARYLRQLKEISQGKISFYEIFKELTVKLPPEIYLEDIEFKSGNDRDLLSLTAVTAYNSEFSSRQVLSRFVNSLESSKMFVNHGEPVIFYSTKDDNKMMSISITCEIATGKGS